jgi:hypothetical protein
LVINIQIFRRESIALFAIDRWQNFIVDKVTLFWPEFVQIICPDPQFTIARVVFLFGTPGFFIYKVCVLLGPLNIFAGRKFVLQEILGSPVDQSRGVRPFFITTGLSTFLTRIWVRTRLQGHRPCIHQNFTCAAQPTLILLSRIISVKPLAWHLHIQRF